MHSIYLRLQLIWTLIEQEDTNLYLTMLRGHLRTIYGVVNLSTPSRSDASRPLHYAAQNGISGMSRLSRSAPK